jgi:hypothetical protein
MTPAIHTPAAQATQADPHAGIVQEGREACLARGVPFRFITENPYPMGTVASEKWREGWMNAHAELLEANPTLYRAPLFH